MPQTVCAQLNHFPSLRDQKLFFRDPCDGTGNDPEESIKDPDRHTFVDVDELYCDDLVNSDDPESIPQWQLLREEELNEWLCSLQREICSALGVSSVDEWKPTEEFLLECIEDELSLADAVKIARPMYLESLRLEFEFNPDDVEGEPDGDPETSIVGDSSSIMKKNFFSWAGSRKDGRRGPRGSWETHVSKRRRPGRETIRGSEIA